VPVIGTENTGRFAMKKIFALICLICCLLLCACAGDGSESTQPTTQTPEVSTSEPTSQTTPSESTSAPQTDVTLTPKSGIITSGYEEGIDLVLEWTATPIGNDYELIFKLSLDCYSLFVGPRNDGALIVDGKKFAVVTVRQEIEENERRTIDFGTYTTSCAAGEVIDVSAKWHFNGSYAGIKYDWIELAGAIDLK
jgi:hypothetical protein